MSRSEKSILESKANSLYARIGKKCIDLERFYREGMIRREDLEHGAYYIGACRNSSVARWHKADGVFYYVRSKFGDLFEEGIPHPVNDDGHDIFVPVQKCDDVDVDEIRRVTERFT